MYISEDENTRLSESTTSEPMGYYQSWEWLTHIAIGEVWEHTGEDHYGKDNFPEYVVATLFNTPHPTNHSMWTYLTKEKIDLNHLIENGTVLRKMTPQGLGRTAAYAEHECSQQAIHTLATYIHQLHIDTGSTPPTCIYPKLQAELALLGSHVLMHDEDDEDDEDQEPPIEKCPKCLKEYHQDLMAIHQTLHLAQEEYQAEIDKATIGKPA